MRIRSAEVCAGYNGLGKAVEQVFGSRTAWFSEFEEAPSRILAHNYPGIPNHGDMTKIDWAAVEPVEILAGGTPCQDLSTSGRRRGMTEGSRSNLAVEFLRAVEIIQPDYVVWENVRGAYSATADSDLEQCPGCMGDTGDGRVVLRALGRLLGSLADLGFDAEWRGLRAADVGACHPRYRVFVLAAHPRRLRRRKGDLPAGIREAGANRAAIPNESDTRPIRPESAATTADRNDIGNYGAGERAEQDWRGQPADSDLTSTNWDVYAEAIARHEAVMGRRAPAPTEPTGRNGGHRLSPRFTEWMMGLPDGWVTDPAIGISWQEQIKACGNGVVPQQAIAALTDMLAAFEHQGRAAA
ncbi:DNA (cytosine-5)-methyltransferase 1 [Arthrobacter sp. ES3-54]|nr:DNA (cytosine-5)-methyltransferase 1 [Arthrobacter sp. ES3-54]